MTTFHQRSKPSPVARTSQVHYPFSDSRIVSSESERDAEFSGSIVLPVMIIYSIIINGEGDILFRFGDAITIRTANHLLVCGNRPFFQLSSKWILVSQSNSSVSSRVGSSRFHPSQTFFVFFFFLLLHLHGCDRRNHGSRFQPQILAIPPGNLHRQDSQDSRIQLPSVVDGRRRRTPVSDGRLSGLSNISIGS
jgi:hypothetical protein